MKIYRTKEILEDFERHIETKTPWALGRFGDGGMKLIHSILFNDQDQLLEIVKKEGIPTEKAKDVLDLWATSANIYNYIDTPEVYFTKEFWPRVRKGKQPMHQDTIDKIREWKKLHVLSGCKNESYCNPEINFLSCLDIFDRGLIEILQNKKVCCITAYPEETVKDRLSFIRKLDVVKIVENNQDHYHNSFGKTVVTIQDKTKKYDVWLVAAGELGRIYTGFIKYNGGISFDIGSTIDYWCQGIIPLRLFWFLKKNDNNYLKLSLTEEGEIYREFI